MQENDLYRQKVKDLEFQCDQFKSSIEAKDKQYEHLKEAMEQ